ncbi:hypothetical protein EDD85DRAFT_951791 [Armillaria nabsnona]|nr:hypothetical protein EDD85DRAFT_951791 [Armillaria nabsnona]
MKRRKALGFNFRCVVSGKYDQTTLSKVSAPTDEIWGAGVVYTQCAHILNENSNEELASVLGVLKSFGYTIEQLNGTNLHSLPNIITVQSDVHEWFTRLEIWFEKTVRNHAHTSLSHPISPPSRTTTQSDTYLPTLTITSASPDNENLPFHHRPAKVAQFSGTAEYIDGQDRVVEDLDTTWVS